jgi:hypothetical protein
VGISRMKMKYTKEDLLWEAVRRNVNFQKFYNDELERRNLSKKAQPEEARLELFLVGEAADWQITRLPDPSIDIDKIKSQMEDRKKRGMDPSGLHPYMNVFRDKNRPVILHSVPGSPYEDIVPTEHKKYMLVEDPASKKVVCIEKSKLINDPYDDRIHRVLISIDPLAADKAIFEEVKRIKAAARNKLEGDLQKKIEGKKADETNENIAEVTRLAGSSRIKKSQLLEMHAGRIDNYID